MRNLTDGAKVKIASREPNQKPEPVRTIQSLRDCPFLLKSFFSNPIEAMKIPLSLSWPEILCLQVGSGFLSGFFSGVAVRTNQDFVSGLVLFPLTSLVICFVFSGFIFSFFSLFHATFLDFKRLHGIVVLSLIPYFFLHLLAGFLPPVDLIGFALTALLLIVGLVEQFALNKRQVMTVVGGLSAAFFLTWMVAQIHLAEPMNLREPSSTPDSISAPTGATSVEPSVKSIPLNAPNRQVPDQIEMADPNL